MKTKGKTRNEEEENGKLENTGMMMSLKEEDKKNGSVMKQGINSGLASRAYVNTCIARTSCSAMSSQNHFIFLLLLLLLSQGEASAYL